MLAIESGKDDDDDDDDDDDNNNNCLYSIHNTTYMDGCIAIRVEC